MSEQITIRVSDYAVQHAAQIAAGTEQSIEAVLSNLIESSLPVELLPDDEVLELSEMRMTEEQDDELSELLARQREGELDREDRYRLTEMMQIYERGLLRKSQALRVAVERGLREPLQF